MPNCDYLLCMYETVTLYLGTVALNRSTSCPPGKPFQPTQEDPDQPDTSSSPSLQCESGPLTSGPLVGSQGHHSLQLHLKTGDSIKIFLFFQGMEGLCPQPFRCSSFPPALFRMFAFEIRRNVGKLLIIQDWIE